MIFLKFDVYPFVLKVLFSLCMLWIEASVAATNNLVSALPLKDDLTVNDNLLSPQEFFHDNRV